MIVGEMVMCGVVYTAQMLTDDHPSDIIASECCNQWWALDLSTTWLGYLEFKELCKHWQKARKGTELLSSEVMQQGLIVNKHDQQSLCQYEMTDYSMSIYSWQPSTGLSSSILILSSGSSQKYPLSDSVGGCTIDDLDHYHSLCATPERQCVRGTPASWHGSSQTRLHKHLSSFLPSNVTASHPSTSFQHFLSKTAPMDPGWLPLDSTLFTPLPGYHPPNLDSVQRYHCCMYRQSHFPMISQWSAPTRGPGEVHALVSTHCFLNP